MCVKATHAVERLKITLRGIREDISFFSVKCSLYKKQIRVKKDVDSRPTCYIVY